MSGRFTRTAWLYVACLVFSIETFAKPWDIPLSLSPTWLAGMEFERRTKRPRSNGRLYGNILHCDPVDGNFGAKWIPP